MKQKLKTLITLLIIIFSILGIFDSGYITYEKTIGKVPSCRPGFACAKVLESPWAYIGPLPLSACGLIYYFAIFSVSSLYLLEYDLKKVTYKIFKKWPNKYTKQIKKYDTRQWLMKLTTFGFLFSLYLVSIMAFIIEGWCLYCLLSALTCFILLILNLSLWHITKYESNI